MQFRRRHYVVLFIVLAYFSILYWEKQLVSNINEKLNSEKQEDEIVSPVLSKTQAHVKEPSTTRHTALLNTSSRKERYIQELTQKYPPVAKCPARSVLRDYNKDPVIFTELSGPMPCAVPCTKGSASEADIGGSSSAKCSKGFEKTMENVGRWIGDDDYIAGNTRLNSDVPIQYFSWAEYQFMRPPAKKTGPAMVVAMISNCGPRYRLDYMQKLMDAGVTVRSTGSCANNAPKDGKDNSYSDRLATKIDIIAKYKFTFSFENSETVDYVTEKLFGPLEAGSVPIYYGAPNAKKFAPNDHSVIFASDFKSPEELARYLIYLDGNDTAYNEYLTWKTEGPSQEWISLMDLAIVHSACRFCIRSADIDRKQVGAEVVTSPFLDENLQELEQYEGTRAKLLKVRERGSFYLRWIHLEDDEQTLEKLKEKIVKKYNKPAKGKVVYIYDLWDRNRNPFTSDLEVAQLNKGQELEVVFENPGSLDRFSYTKWWYERQGLAVPSFVDI